MKSGIHRLVSRQVSLCNSLANGAKAELGKPDDQREKEAKEFDAETTRLSKENKKREADGVAPHPIPEAPNPFADLLLVKLGSPKNKTLLRLMENLLEFTLRRIYCALMSVFALIYCKSLMINCVKHSMLSKKIENT